MKEIIYLQRRPLVRGCDECWIMNQNNIIILSDKYCYKACKDGILKRVIPLKLFKRVPGNCPYCYFYTVGIIDYCTFPKGKDSDCSSNIYILEQ